MQLSASVDQAVIAPAHVCSVRIIAIACRFNQLELKFARSADEATHPGFGTVYGQGCSSWLYLPPPKSAGVKG